MELIFRGINFREFVIFKEFCGINFREFEKINSAKINPFKGGFTRAIFWHDIPRDFVARVGGNRVDYAQPEIVPKIVPKNRLEKSSRIGWNRFLGRFFGTIFEDKQ